MGNFDLRNVTINHQLCVEPHENEVFLQFKYDREADRFLDWLEERGWSQFKFWMEVDGDVA